MSGEMKKKKRKRAGTGDGEAAAAGDLYFQGVSVYFVETGIQPRRLQIWKQKLQQLGGVTEDRFSKHLTHIFAANIETLTEKLGKASNLRKRKQIVVTFSWIEDCLKAGKRLPTDSYELKVSSESEVPSQNPNGDDAVRGLGVDSASQQGEGPDWMQIIKKGGGIGAVGRALGGKGARQKEGEESMLEENSMEDAGHELTEAGYTPPDVNEHITSLFSEIKNIYKEALGDERRAFSYAKALSMLEKIPFRITSVDQIKGLPTIGKSLVDSIQEILSTGKLSKLEHLKNDPKVQVISLFGSVWGIGPTTAQKLYNKGHRSLEDLKNDSSLTPPQRIGLEFHDDIIKKIPRHEITVMDAIVQKAGAELHPGVTIVCGGSYRRGKTKSGDIDFIATHPDGHSHKGFLRKLVSKLHTEEFLTEDLRLSLEHSIEDTDHGVDTYFGLCKYPGRSQRHRIDLKVYPFDQYPFGLIQWTGNDILNRKLRIMADKQGYKLDDHGLFPVISDEHGGKVKSSISVPCKSEREVFEKLGFPWLEPHERNL